MHHDDRGPGKTKELHNGVSEGKTKTERRRRRTIMPFACLRYPSVVLSACAKNPFRVFTMSQTSFPSLLHDSVADVVRFSLVFIPILASDKSVSRPFIRHKPVSLLRLSLLDLISTRLSSPSHVKRLPLSYRVVLYAFRTRSFVHRRRPFPFRFSERRVSFVRPSARTPSSRPRFP